MRGRVKILFFSLLLAMLLYVAGFFVVPFAIFSGDWSYMAPAFTIDRILSWHLGAIPRGDGDEKDKLL